MRRDLLVTALCLLIPGFFVEGRAEVRVFTHRDGSYKVTRVLQRHGRGGGVWTPFRRADSRMSLNADGDRNGDLFPVIRESPAAPHHPWVVWSRYQRGGYRLVWSRWDGAGWKAIGRLEPPDIGRGDSLDPDLRFDGNGRPHLVWWRRERGGGRVYLSLFAHASWTAPIAVSEPGVDARYPTVEFDGADTVIVTYRTQKGVVRHEVLFNLPVTITDDINPLDYMETEGGAVVVH